VTWDPVELAAWFYVAGQVVGLVLLVVLVVAWLISLAIERWRR